ncbi:hypothetical protein PPYR_12859 [Photinus pyralis]|uniref:Peptidase S1 domain-containing protein n=1 Tax=Photinus pyralis TaxID=7054 RepID=A0A1Y1KH68_PHOPY|nr:chymotrypsin-2-like [Photinus pyralis]KAB0793239.1 hypothetical protein PPYR_12859 [Photinus pyralis]
MNAFGAVVIALAWISVESFEQRLIGGQKAKISDFPFYASIRIYPNRYACGAAIIDRFWVMTAAQCVYSVHPSSLVVVAGTSSLNETGDRYGVHSVHVHPLFNAAMKTNDTALLRLTRSVVYSKNVSSIALATDSLPGGKTLELCGHGATQYPFTNMSVPLMSVELKSITNAQCSAALNRPITKYNLCTKGKTTKGACVGDVGGPLTKRGGVFGTTKLYGTVSWGYPCSQGMPDVYSSVLAARPWIRTISGL